MIPAELRERGQWVCWRRELRDGKPTKVPIDATTGKTASTTDPSTWTTFEAATTTAARPDIDGIGFVFTDRDEFTGVDLDACLIDGELHPDAAHIVTTLDSYTERSVSRTGLHVIVRADLGGHPRNRTAATWAGGLEIYDRGRYFTMTGDRFENTPEVCEARQSELEAVLAEWLPAPDVDNGGPIATRMSRVTDHEVLARAFGARNGARLEALYGGDRAGYPSESEADLALLGMLAFWTGPDPEQLDRLFRGSSLARAKWDRADYRERTITKALAGCAEFFDWPAPPAPIEREHAASITTKTGNTVEVADTVEMGGAVEVVDTAELLAAVRAFVGRFVVLPSGAVGDLVALWILHTHAFEAFWATPYLRIVSAAPDSGKTLLLEILAALCRRGWHAVNPSPAVLYRKVDRDCPTLLLDELDNYPVEDRRDALSVLNSGYKRGARVDRCKENGELVSFDAFCPKAFAGLDQRALADTLLSRSITVRMQRKTSAEKVDMWIAPLVEPEAAALRERCAVWGEQNADALAGHRPDLLGLFNRAAEVWWPLLSIAELARGDWPRRAEAAVRELAAGGDDADQVPEQVQLLIDIRAAFGAELAIATTRLLGYLNSLDESPWGARRRGEGLDARALARMLRPFKIRPRTIGSGTDSAKGYRWDQFADAFARHLSQASEAAQASHRSPDAERDATDTTDAPDVQAHPDGADPARNDRPKPAPVRRNGREYVPDVSDGQLTVEDAIAEFERRLEEARRCDR